MSSIDQEEVLFTLPSGSSLGVSIDSIVVTNSTFTNSTITNLQISNVNGSPVSGTLVTTGGTQTLTNKTIIGGSSGNIISANQINGV